jgi:chromate transporter
VGAIVGGLCFIVPGLVVILALASIFLAAEPPLAVAGAAAGAGAAVAAVALQASTALMPASWRRAGAALAGRSRWLVYAAAGGVSAATIGPWLVLVLLACGLAEVASQDRRRRARPTRSPAWIPLAVVAPAAAVGGTAAVAWVGFKVGALSYGGGFVIVPLMQHNAVDTYHWMTSSQFLSAVALGQITPGPVVQTVAVVGYAAGGVAAGLLASLCAFAPSFVFVLAGGPHFDQLRANRHIQAFLTGAGAAAIGAIAGSSIPLAAAINHLWQVGVLALAAVWLLALRRGVVAALIGAGALGVIAALAGAPV